MIKPITIIHDAIEIYFESGSLILAKSSPGLSIAGYVKNARQCVMHTGEGWDVRSFSQGLTVAI